MNNVSDEYKISGYCLFWGEHFYPSKAEQTTGVHFDEMNEPGELGVTGRYKNKPTPYGSASINFLHTGNTPDILPVDINIINILSDNLSAFRRAGADEITLYINVYYTEQCNMQLSPELLQVLAKLNIPVAISAIDIGKEV